MYDYFLATTDWFYATVVEDGGVVGYYHGQVSLAFDCVFDFVFFSLLMLNRNFSNLKNCQSTSGITIKQITMNKQFLFFPQFS